MKMKTKFKITKITALIGVIWWQLESWYFIYEYGWHWEAINSAEKICDKIAFGLWTLSLIFFFSILYDIVTIFVGIKSVTIEKNNEPDIRPL